MGKNKKSKDGISMLIIGLLMIILSIVILISDFYGDIERKKFIGALLLVLGALTLFGSVLTIYKNKKYENSVLYEFLIYPDEKIKQKLSVLKMGNNIGIEKNSNVIIVLKYDNISYEAYIYKTKITFIADCEESYYNSLNNAKKVYLDSLLEEHSTLLITKEEVLDKFIKFIEKSHNKI